MTTPGIGNPMVSQQPIRDIPNADYGENASYRALQQAAPLAASSGQPSGTDTGINPAANVVGLGEPTTRPGEDIMTGAGSMAVDQRAEDIASKQAWLPVLRFMSDASGASWALRNAVRMIQGG